MEIYSLAREQRLVGVGFQLTGHGSVSRVLENGEIFRMAGEIPQLLAFLGMREGGSRS